MLDLLTARACIVATYNTVKFLISQVNDSPQICILKSNHQEREKAKWQKDIKPFLTIPFKLGLAIGDLLPWKSGKTWKSCARKAGLLSPFSLLRWMTSLLSSSYVDVPLESTYRKWSYAWRNYQKIHQLFVLFLTA